MQNDFESIVNVGSRTFLHANDIVMMVAEINYTTLFLSNGNKLLVSYHLGKLHERLINYPSFIRPNRNTIINTNHLEDFGIDTLKINGHIIKVSRRRKEAILDSLRIT